MACQRPLPERGQRVANGGSKQPLLSALALSLLVGVAVLLIGGSPVPSYQGKPVRSWIEDLASAEYQIRDNAVAAIQALGPEGRPFLIRALRRQQGLLP